MTEQTLEANVPLQELVMSNVIAEGVSYEAFMAGYLNQRMEWVDGKVIQMPSVDKQHDALARFLDNLFEAYLTMTAGGRVLQAPMLMRLPEGVSRAPDLQVLLPESMEKLRQNEVVGAADLVVEIVSKGSQRTDRIEKFAQYERGGVREYWIIDPLYQEALFYVVGEEGKYERVAPNETGVYTSVVLARLGLPVAMLWQETLPTIIETLALVQKSLAEHGA